MEARYYGTVPTTHGDPPGSHYHFFTLVNGEEVRVETDARCTIEEINNCTILSIGPGGVEEHQKPTGAVSNMVTIGGNLEDWINNLLAVWKASS